MTTATSTWVQNKSSASPSASPIAAGNASAVPSASPSSAAPSYVPPPSASASASGGGAYPFDLPNACNLLLAPVDVLSTSGSIRLGVRAATARLLGKDDDDDPSPPSASDDESDDYAEPSPFPSIGPAGSVPLLPAGLLCEWLLDAGEGQHWELNWTFVDLSRGDGGDGGCLKATNFASLTDGGVNGDLLDVQCDLPSSEGPVSLSTRSSLALLSVVVDEESRARGFELSFRLASSLPAPSPAPSAGASPVPAASSSAVPVVNADCTVSEWSSWGNCSKQCGGGVETRTRVVTAPATGDGVCVPLEDVRPCNTASCGPQAPNIDCRLSDWSAWSACDVPPTQCGNGTRSRTRTIAQPASGTGQPCPGAAGLMQTEVCSVPCILPACDPALRPSKPTASSGVIGIGQMALQPRFPGNSQCEWTLDPAAMGAGTAAQVVKVTLDAVNIPTSNGCNSQYLQFFFGNGEAASEKLCGSVVPSSLQDGSVRSRPGEAITAKLVTVDGSSNERVGFHAAYSLVSAAAGPSPPPQSLASASATLSLRGSSLWATFDPSTLVLTARADFAEATGAAEYRFTGFSYQAARTGPGGTRLPPELTVQVVPPIAGGSGRVRRALTAEQTVFEIITAIYSQLHNPQSKLMQGTVTRGLDGQTLDVVYGSPASLSFLPSTLAIDVPYQHATSGVVSVPLKIVNNGGSQLVVSSASFEYSGGSADPSVAPYGNSLLSLTPPPTWPLTLPGSAAPPRAETSLTISVDLSKIPSGSSATAFAVLQFEHNDATGSHAVPVVVRIVGAPSPGPSAGSGSGDSVSDLVASTSFRIGMATGAGTLVCAMLTLCCSYCCCCRKNSDGVTICGRLCSKRKGAGAKGASGSSKSGKSAPGTDSKGPKRRGEKSLDLELSLSDSDSDSADESKSGRDRRRKSKRGSKGEKGDSSDSDGDNERRGLTSSSSSSKRKETELAVELTKLGSGKAASSTDASNDIGKGSTTISRSGQVVSSSASAGASLFGGLDTKWPASASSALAAAPAPVVMLNPKPVMKAKDFELQWSSLVVHELWGVTLKRKFVSATGAGETGELEKALQPFAVSCLASGTVGDVTKYFVYAQSIDGVHGLAEISVDSKTLRLSALVKSGNAQVGAALIDAIRKCLASMSITAQ
jgi:hypothetical protein